MATLHQRVEDYIGTFSDTEAVDNWLTESAAMILRRLPETEARLYATEADVLDAGISLTQKLPLYATRDSRGCIMTGGENEGRVADPASFFYATSWAPVAIINNNLLKIYPSGGTKKLTAIIYPTVGGASTTVPNIPSWGEGVCILYSAIRARQKQITDLTSELPTPPTAPGFTYTDAVGAQILSSALYSIDLTTDFTQALTYIQTEEDIELARGHVEKILARLQEFQRESEIEFQRNLENARASSETDRVNRINQLSRHVQEYTAVLEKYARDLQRIVQKIATYRVGLASMTEQYNLMLITHLGVVMGQGKRGEAIDDAA
jgi:hypothetical protein